MARRKKQRNYFYAVADGRCPPSIFTSWFQAGPMVNKCPRNMYEGFHNFQDAKHWLLEQGHQTFHFVIGCSDGPKSQTNTHAPEDDSDCHPEWYAVANGQSPGIYSTYGSVKLQVDGYSNAIFKSYATWEAARAALEGAADQLKWKDAVGMSVSSEDSQQISESLAKDLASISLSS